MIHNIDTRNLDAFLSERPFAVILFDAAWDIGPGSAIEPRFQAASAELGTEANFGRADVDSNRDLCQRLGVSNVPTVAYFRSGIPVAVLVGAFQQVGDRVRSLIEGRQIDRHDGMDGWDWEKNTPKLFVS
jgi:thioredoxin-like negative regulator of GroEL